MDPSNALSDLIRWVRKRAGSDADAKHRADLLIQRLRRIRKEVSALEK